MLEVLGLDGNTCHVTCVFLLLYTMYTLVVMETNNPAGAFYYGYSPKVYNTTGKRNKCDLKGRYFEVNSLLK